MEKEYPERFTIDAVAYGNKHNDGKASLQFGISLEKAFMRAMVNIEPLELQEHQLQPAETVMRRRMNNKDVEKEDLNKTLDDKLSRWILDRLRVNCRPTLVEVSLQGLKIAKELKLKEFFPSRAWGHRFILKMKLESKWRHSHVEVQRSVIAQETDAKDSSTEKLNEQLSRWIIKRIENDQRPTLKEIGDEATRIGRINKQTNATKYRNWSYKFMKEIKLLEKWQLCGLQEGSPNLHAADFWILQRHQINDYKQDAQKDNFDQDLSNYIVQRLNDDQPPTLMEIAEEGSKIGAQVGRTITGTRTWGINFLKKVKLHRKWKFSQEKQARRQEEIKLLKESRQEQLDIHLSDWLSKRMNSRQRPSLRQISLKGLEIARRIDADQFLPSTYWADCFLRRVALKSDWKNCISNDEMLKAVNKTTKVQPSGWDESFNVGQQITVEGLEFVIAEKKYHESMFKICEQAIKSGKLPATLPEKPQFTICAFAPMKTEILN